MNQCGVTQRFQNSHRIPTLILKLSNLENWNRPVILSTIRTTLCLVLKPSLIVKMEGMKTLARSIEHPWAMPQLWTLTYGRTKARLKEVRT